ncbi:AzlC family ABC transporter permease [Corynebacterium stationis]|uniref:AzlC family ABC transporter permease n=1 Tax=Corynebacterium stationis TaxID=1705 RepID=UPI00273CA87C|nr:AzlC family ABC transporter permease [Corynebacterium stationis]WLP88320.1 AzlC family ABC transporter permease [Corynebacterium stationis]
MVHLKFPARLVRVYFSLHVVRNPIAKFFSVYALTDEAYAVTAAEPKGWTSWRLLALQISFQTYWVGGGILGVLLAGVIPGKIEGLEFALCAQCLLRCSSHCATRRRSTSHRCGCPLAPC